MTTALVIAVVAGLVAISLRWLPLPYVWILAIAAAVSLARFARSRTIRAKAIWWNLGVVLLIFAATESFLAVREYRRRDVEASRIHSYQVYDPLEDPDLGYVLRPASTRTARKLFDDEVIYEVVYTVDPQGLRVSPPPSEQGRASILFFGGSYSYGEGVNDHETMPYQVGLKARGRYDVYNFGVHGYGPQHMLALIEFGKVAATVDPAPAWAIYQAMVPEHVYRVAGLRPWVRMGPRYVLTPDGDVVRSGAFSDQDCNHAICTFALAQLRKSAAGRLVLDYTRHVGEPDEDLFVAVVAKASRLLKQTYPGLRFHVLLWRGHPGVVMKLEHAGVSVHRVDGIFESAGLERGAPRLHRRDRHPAPEAHALIADYVVDEILGPQR